MWLMEQIMWKSFDKRLAAFLLEETVLEESDLLKITHEKIANICWIIEKARNFQKNICFIDYAKAFDCVNHNKLWKILKVGNIRSPYMPPEKPVC